MNVGTSDITFTFFRKFMYLSRSIESGKHNKHAILTKWTVLKMIQVYNASIVNQLIKKRGDQRLTHNSKKNIILNINILINNINSI